MTEHLENVLRRPIISEKSIRLAKENQYTFEVVPRATRTQVKQAVLQMFENVEVDAGGYCDRHAEDIALAPDAPSAHPPGRLQKGDRHAVEGDHPHL